MEAGFVIFLFMTGAFAFFVLGARRANRSLDPADIEARKTAVEARRAAAQAKLDAAAAKRAGKTAKKAQIDEAQPEQDAPSVQVQETVDPYELAMAELVSEEIDNAVWAKAFALSENDEATRRMYVKLRGEQLSKNGASTPNANVKAEGAAPKFNPINVAYFFVMLAPAHLLGALVFNVANGFPTSLPEVASGQLWLGYVLWPFAVGYILWKRQQ